MPAICCSCGVIVAAEDDRVVNLEGNPDHAINQGPLCSKGTSLVQPSTMDSKVNPNRLQKVKYRAPGSSTWEEKDWHWASSRSLAIPTATRCSRDILAALDRIK
jgi:formate dehydrogenase major subunit